MVYLVIVRPLEYCIVKSLQDIFGESATADDQRLYLFARRGEVVSAKVLCAWFNLHLPKLELITLACLSIASIRLGW
jgi:hypothetical protein